MGIDIDLAIGRLTFARLHVPQSPAYAALQDALIHLGHDETSISDLDQMPLPLFKAGNDQVQTAAAV